MRSFALAAILTLFFSNTSFAGVSPEAAGLLSVVPGLGQVAHGDPIRGLAWLGAVAATFFSGNGDIKRNGISLWQYNVYDAYQNAGGRNTAKNNVFQNTLGAYNPLNLVDPIGAPQLAANAYEIISSSPDTVYRGPHNVLVGTLWQTPNALAEEALYRGYFFPVISNAVSSKVVGAVVSTVLFDFGHMLYGGYTLNKVYAGSLNNIVNGLLWCWQTDRNHYDLRHSIFTHMWIDAMIYYRWNGNLGTGGTGSSGGGGGAPMLGLKLNYFI